MTDAKRHRNDSADACYFCLNFRLIPIEGAGKFKCENKNTPDELKTCFNFEPREVPTDQSFEIYIHDKGEESNGRAYTEGNR